MIEKIIHLPLIEDQRGNLTFVEQFNHIPLDIKRIKWLSNPNGYPGGSNNSGRMHKAFIVALSGSFNVVVNSGGSNFTYQLNKPNYGLYVPDIRRRQITNSSDKALALILTPDYYDGKEFVGSTANFKLIKMEYSRVADCSIIVLPGEKSNYDIIHADEQLKHVPF